MREGTVRCDVGKDDAVHCRIGGGMDGRVVAAYCVERCNPHGKILTF